MLANQGREKNTHRHTYMKCVWLSRRCWDYEW